MLTFNTQEGFLYQIVGLWSPHRLMWCSILLPFRICWLHVLSLWYL